MSSVWNFKRLAFSYVSFSSKLFPSSQIMFSFIALARTDGCLYRAKLLGSFAAWKLCYVEGFLHWTFSTWKICCIETPCLHLSDKPYRWQHILYIRTMPWMWLEDQRGQSNNYTILLTDWATISRDSDKDSHYGRRFFFNRLVKLIRFGDKICDVFHRMLKVLDLDFLASHIL